MLTANDVMTPSVVAVAPKTSPPEVIRLLHKSGTTGVPVVRDSRLVRILSRGNLLKALAATDMSKSISVDERTIRERLTTQLQAQRWAHTMIKNIIVENGIFNLSGFVRSEDKHGVIRVAAENMPGVTWIENQMVRRPTSYDE